MKYSNIISGIFISRPNRFIANVMIDDKLELAHVKNTGRCKELLIPGVLVYLEKHNNPNRKTKYSLIAVQKENTLINIDSQAPNKVLFEALKEGFQLPGLKDKVTYLKPETTYKNSRFDIYLESKNEKVFIEVKGVTLENDGVVLFPDAPTERGVKHIRELISAVEEGYLGYIVFIAQVKGIKYFTPNDSTDENFGIALREASNMGVNILAYDCLVEKDELKLNSQIQVCL